MIRADRSLPTVAEPPSASRTPVRRCCRGREAAYWAVLTLLLMTLAPGSLQGAAHEEATQEPAPPAGLAAQEWRSIGTLIREAEYEATWRTRTGLEDVVEAWEAPNRAHDFRILFAAGGVHLLPRRQPEPSWRWRMELVGYGRAGAVEPIGSAELVARKNRVEYRRGPVTEWYVNDRRGLEQGFTLTEPPEGGEGNGEVVLELELAGDLEPAVTADGRSLVLRNDEGALLGYRDLRAFDAQGRELPAHLLLASDVGLTGEPERLTIRVDDTDAVYPLTVDPLLASEVAKLTASDASTNDRLGHSVAISGDTVVVGASFADLAVFNEGAAYVFERNQGGADLWGEVRKLTASDGAQNDYFGHTVAISGDTIAVGAFSDDDFGSQSGAVYVFERNQGGADQWGEVKKLTASDAAAGDSLGLALSISGDTLVSGAPRDDCLTFIDCGAAYVFSRNHGGADNWGEVEKLVASDAAEGDSFGGAVSISGDSVAVGAPGDDCSVFADCGAAYLFSRNQGGTDNWGQVAKLVASDAADTDQFGIAVAISGDTVVSGARYDDDNGDGSGSAYVFSRNQGGTDNWGQVAKLVASDGAAADLFGDERTVAISGDTVVVGAPQSDAAATDSGAAYVFSRNQGGADMWGEVQKLTASDAAETDILGAAVAISGDAIVVGAPFDDDAGDWSGSAYVFVCCGTDPGEWQEVAKTTASDADAGDNFGNAVGISGDTMVIGAYRNRDVGLQSGSAYIFSRNQGGGDGWEKSARSSRRIWGGRRIRLLGRHLPRYRGGGLTFGSARQRQRRHRLRFGLHLRAQLRSRQSRHAAGRQLGRGQEDHPCRCGSG